MGILVEFSRRVPLAPGVYELRCLTVEEARQVAEWLAREKLGGDGTLLWQTQEGPSSERFGLPRVKEFPPIEVVPAEVTEASLEQLAREIGPRAEAIVTASSWRLSEWRSVLPVKVRRKKDIPAVLPDYPELVVQYGAALGCRLPSLSGLMEIPGVGETYGPTLKRAPGPEISLGALPGTTPTLGKTFAMWRTIPANAQEYEEVNIFDMPPADFARLWRSLDISRSTVRTLLLRDPHQLTLPKEKGDLERALGQCGRTWLEIARQALEVGADPIYAAEYLGAVVRVKFVEGYATYNGQETTVTLDPLKILGCLELLQVSTSGGAMTAWARVTGERKDDLLELVHRPDADVLKITVEVIL